MSEQDRIISGGRRHGKILEQLEMMILAVRTGQTALMMSPEFVVMTKDHYDELMTKIHPREQPQMWIDESGEMGYDEAHTELARLLHCFCGGNRHRNRLYDRIGSSLSLPLCYMQGVVVEGGTRS